MINEKTPCSQCKKSHKMGAKFCVACGNQVARYHSIPPLACGRCKEAIKPNATQFNDGDGHNMLFRGLEDWTPDMEPAFTLTDNKRFCPICGRSVLKLKVRVAEMVTDPDPEPMITVMAS